MRKDARGLRYGVYAGVAIMVGLAIWFLYHALRLML